MRNVRRVVAVVLGVLLAGAATAVAAVQGAGAVLTVTADPDPAGAPGGGTSTPMMLLRESFEVLLTANGLSLAEWHNGCATQAPQCQQGVMLAVKSLVASQLLDASGRAMFPAVPPGRYYLFAMRAASSSALNVWDLRTDLQSGANAIQLTARNLALQNGVRASAPAALAAGAPPAPGPAARPIDPSIAKAQAAKVDTRVFGIPLGEPLQLPECDPFSVAISGGLAAPTGVSYPKTCVNTLTSGLTGLVAAFLPANVDQDQNTAIIELGKDLCPVWMAGCQVVATLSQGLLAGVTLITKGPGVEALLAKELRGKYGSPTLSRAGTVTPDIGKEFTTTNLEWVLPGLHVEYEVVRMLEEVTSTRVRTTEGRVRVETEAAYQLRLKEVDALTKPKL